MFQIYPAPVLKAELGWDRMIGVTSLVWIKFCWQHHAFLWSIHSCSKTNVL